MSGDRRQAKLAGGRQLDGGVRHQCGLAVLGAALPGQKLKPVLRRDGLCFSGALARWATGVKHRHFSDQGIEDAAGRTDDYLATYLRARAYEAMRRSSWHEYDVSRAKLEQFSVETKVVVPLADDEGLVVGRMPVIPAPDSGGSMASQTV